MIFGKKQYQVTVGTRFLCVRDFFTVNEENQNVKERGSALYVPKDDELDDRRGSLAGRRGELALTGRDNCPNE